MASQRLHIDRLELRLRGLDPALGQSLDGELRRALEQGLAGVANRSGRSRHMDNLTLEPVKVAPGTTGRGVAEAASGALARSLRGLARGG